MAAPAATKLDSTHHTFLQAVMRRGPLSERAAMAIYKSLVNQTGTGFVPFLLAINQELGFVQMEVKKIMNQYDGNVFYGIINTLANKEAKLGTQLSQAQILFFSAVMKAIALDPTASGVIRSTAAMYLTIEPEGENNTQTAPVRLSMQARQEALDSLVAEQLLSRTDDGGVALGVNAFLELGRVFRTLEVPFCGICNEAAIKAQLCSTVDCPQRAHVYCINRGSQSLNQRPKCTSCQTVWARTAEEEGAGTQEEEFTVPIATQETAKTSTRPRTSRRKRSAPVSDDEGEEHAEADGDEAEDDVRYFRRTRSSRKS